jgi:hypothetical protein
MCAAYQRRLAELELSSANKVDRVTDDVHSKLSALQSEATALKADNLALQHKIAVRAFAIAIVLVLVRPGNASLGFFFQVCRG